MPWAIRWRPCPTAALPGEIRCAGGAARSDLWLQIKADVLGVATAATVCPEPTSLGAAVLAKACARRNRRADGCPAMGLLEAAASP